MGSLSSALTAVITHSWLPSKTPGFLISAQISDFQSVKVVGLAGFEPAASSSRTKNGPKSLVPTDSDPARQILLMLLEMSILHRRSLGFASWTPLLNSLANELFPTAGNA
jgi:hypothetical protein